MVSIAPPPRKEDYKTKEEYEILPRKTISFKASNKISEKLKTIT